jgi:hypothetical protein
MAVHWVSKRYQDDELVGIAQNFVWSIARGIMSRSDMIEGFQANSHYGNVDFVPLLLSLLISRITSGSLHFFGK